MIYLEMWWSFVKIGFTSFGGLSMIPLINSEMVSHGWMNTSEVSDIVAIAEMTPGPVGLNCATFAGMRTAGLPGAICCNIGVLAPTFTLTIIAALFFEKFKNSKVLENMFTGIRPCCVGLAFGAMILLGLSNFFVVPSADIAEFISNIQSNGGIFGIIDIPVVIMAVIDAVLLIKCKLSIPLTIIINAAAGILLFGILGL